MVLREVGFSAAAEGAGDSEILQGFMRDALAKTWSENGGVGFASAVLPPEKTSRKAGEAVPHRPRTARGVSDG